MVFSGLYLSRWQGKHILLLAAVDPTVDLCTRFPRQCAMQSLTNKKKRGRAIRDQENNIDAINPHYQVGTFTAQL